LPYANKLACALLRAASSPSAAKRVALAFRDADTNPLDPKDTAHQRQLNDAGRAAAKSMGDALRKLKIPVGKVQTS